MNIVTLGVKNIKEARAFYENGLGWKISSASNEHIVFIQLNSIVLTLYSRAALAQDANLKNEPSSFGGITLSYNARTKTDVEQALEMAKKAGAKILKPAQDVFWGGFSGYFADLDGYAWEIAWNPHFQMDLKGNLQLP